MKRLASKPLLAGGSPLHLVSALNLLLAATAAHGETVVTVATISLEAAQKAAAESLRKCQADGYRISVTVVDRSGTSVVTARADGAGPHTLDSSRRKAYSAVSLRESTRKLAEIQAGSPELRALGNMNESILLLAGGFPIRIGGEIVGGIGVGGAPGGPLDEACARAGLRAIGADAYENGVDNP